MIRFWDVYLILHKNTCKTFFDFEIWQFLEIRQTSIFPDISETAEDIKMRFLVTIRHFCKQLDSTIYELKLSNCICSIVENLTHFRKKNHLIGSFYPQLTALQIQPFTYT